jgi:hypothetical protein
MQDNVHLKWHSKSNEMKKCILNNLHFCMYTYIQGIITQNSE